MIDCCTLETTRITSSSSSEVSMSSSPSCTTLNPPLLMDNTDEDDPIAIAISSSSQAIKEDEKEKETKSNNSNNKKKCPFAHVLTQPSTIEELITYQEIKFEEQYSRILPAAPVPSELPSYEWKDISIDTVLGQGSFSFVFQVSASCIDGEADKPIIKAALKCLKASSISNEEEFICNAHDLYSESNLLERLNHPHIIKLLGTCQLGLVESFKQSDGYFVMLEIMKDTLQERLNMWRNNMIHDDDDDTTTLLSKTQIISRLQSIAMPVLDAMEYLHSNQIVLRDLKPENIGFDQNGCVKLFDFGLARGEHLLKEETDMAGSILYMAPEVLHLSSLSGNQNKSKPISFPSDVYSFAIVVWELCTLDIPLRKYTTLDEVVTNVGGSKKYRPSLSGIPSGKIKTLLANTWKQNPEDRPTFIQLRGPLETILKIGSSKNGNGGSSKTSGGNVPKRTRSGGVGGGRSTTPKRKLITLGFKSSKSALF